MLTKVSITIFETLQRHGPLPSHYLLEFCKPVDRFAFLHHLRDLLDDRYLARPSQLNNPLVFTDYKVYELREKARAVLGHRLAIPVAGDYRHKLMAACITANIELGVRQAGYRYISQEDILAGRHCQQVSLALPASISFRLAGTIKIWDRPVVPDQLFGIEYSSDNARFFALEADRGTEPMSRPDFKQNSILKKILQYQSALSTRAFRKIGIPNLFPLFVTTENDEASYNRESRVDHMIRQARTAYPQGSNFLLFKAITGFRPYVRTPPLVPALFVDPYQRTGESFTMASAQNFDRCAF